MNEMLAILQNMRNSQLVRLLNTFKNLAITLTPYIRDNGSKDDANDTIINRVIIIIFLSLSNSNQQIVEVIVGKKKLILSLGIISSRILL